MECRLCGTTAHAQPVTTKHSTQHEYTAVVPMASPRHVTLRQAPVCSAEGHVFAEVHYICQLWILAMATATA